MNKKIIQQIWLPILLVLACLCTPFTSVYAQNTRVTIQLKDVRMKQVMTEIEKQTRYLFAIDDDVDVTRSVSVNVINQPLQEALIQMVKGSDVSYQISGSNIILKKRPIQKPVTVSGTVQDQNKLPVVGASIIVKGTAVGTSTNADGSFSLQIPPPTATAQLEINFLGYEPVVVSVGSRTVFNITLKESAAEIEQVVVTALGIKRQEKALSYNVQQVKSSAITDVKDANFINSLNGKVAGVNINASSAGVGGASKVIMRGMKSISQTSNALYVIDGVPMFTKAQEGSTEFGSQGTTDPIADINPEDIESISVLKDASAAIYGVEAGNGVVLITTKKGKKGDGRIFYDFTYGITSLARKADLMNAEQYVAYQTAAGNSQSLSAWDGKTDTDWFDVLYGDNGSFQRHTAGVEMANDYGSVYASLSYMDNDGMYYGNKDWLKRVTFQLNGDYKVKKWLTFTTNNTVESSRSQNSGDGVSNLGNSNQFINPYGMDPLLPAFWDKDNLPAYMTELIAQQGDDMFMKNEKGDYVGIPFAAKDAVNPLTHYYSNTGEHKNFALRGASSLVFAPVEGLTVTSRVGYRLEQFLRRADLLRRVVAHEDAIGRKDHDEPLLHVGELRQLQQHVRQAHDQRDGRYVLPVRVEQLHFGFDQRPDRQQQQFPPLGLRFDRRDQRRGRQSRRNVQYQLLRPCRLYVRQPLQHHGQFPRRRFRPLQIVEGSPLGLFPLGVGRVDDLQRAVHARYRPQDHFVPEAPRFVRCQR